MNAIDEPFIFISRIQYNICFNRKSLFYRKLRDYSIHKKSCLDHLAETACNEYEIGVF